MPMQRVSWADSRAKNGFYVNRIETTSGFRYPSHDHRDHWEFVYVSSGSFRHEINGCRLIHGEGELYLIRDRDRHSLRGERFSYVNLAFTPVWLERLELFAGVGGLKASLNASASPPKVSVPIADRHRVDARFDQLMRASDDLRAGLLFSRTLAELVEMFSLDWEPPPAADAASLPWLADLLRWAEKEGGRPSARAFCEKSGYSREHVIRQTRLLTGSSPTEYLENLRIKRACDLLQFTNYPILRIAQDTGWRSLRHFQRRFASLVGCAASEYRKRRAQLAH